MVLQRFVFESDMCECQQNEITYVQQSTSQGTESASQPTDRPANRPVIFEAPTGT